MSDQLKIYSYAFIATADGASVLCEHTPQGWQLPCAQGGHRWFNRTGPLQKGLSEAVGAPLVALRGIARGLDEAAGLLTRIVDVELTGATPADLVWVPAADLAAAPLIDPEHQALMPDYREAIARRLAELGGAPVSPLRLPWAQRGWHADVKRWLSETLSAGGLKLVALEQVKSWQISAVLRVITDGPTCYFKATPPIFHREAAVTRALSARYPDLMPKVVGARPESGWLLLEAFPEGKDLFDVTDLSVWERLMRQYAHLQMDWVDATAELMDLGCLDRSPRALVAQVDEIVAMLSTVSGLTEDEAAQFRAAAPRLKAMCYELDGLGIPVTLEHGDLHPWNVHVAGETIMIYDWTDACVAHPFFSLATMWEPMEREGLFKEIPDVKQKLFDAYLTPWERFADRERLMAAQRLARILSNLHQVVTNALIIVPILEMAELGDVTAHWIRRVLMALREEE